MAYYKRYIPNIHLSIEKSTDNVPDDGKYYILKDSEIIFNSRSLKKADEYFNELVKKSGFKPNKNVINKQSPSQESIERYLDAKAVFYAIGPIRKKGGRGGRGGV